ncbi:MAG: DUF4968 domain-containing protein, partial [Actinomycetota bacterium]|nr:DUF4968 domain-containing protein [Actinomycetota bacterium]
MPGVRSFAVIALATGLAAMGAESAGAAAIVDGRARFEVITPSLVRLEYAADRRFEDRRTLTTGGRMRTQPRFETSVARGERVIRTSRLTLRWRRRSGPFGDDNLRVSIGAGRALRPRPGPNPAPLGGWRRSLDIVDGPVRLHEGMLSRAGWYLLDDSETALLTRAGFDVRPERSGRYQDLY